MSTYNIEIRPVEGDGPITFLGRKGHGPNVYASRKAAYTEIQKLARNGAHDSMGNVLFDIVPVRRRK